MPAGTPAGIPCSSPSTVVNRANVEVDITALDAVGALRRELQGRGIVFALARVKQDLRAQLEAFGLVASVGPELIFPTLPTAVAAYEQWRDGG